MDNLFRSRWLSRIDMLIHHFINNGFTLTLQDFKNYMDSINYMKLDHHFSLNIGFVDGYDKYSTSQDPAWKSKSIYIAYKEGNSGYRDIFLFIKSKYDIKGYYHSLINDLDEKFNDKIENINGKHRILLPTGSVFVENNINNNNEKNDYHREWPLGDNYITIDFALLDKNDPPVTRDYSTILKLFIKHDDMVFTIENHFNEIMKKLKDKIKIGLTENDNKMIDKYIVTAIQYKTETEPVIKQMKRIMNNKLEYYEMLYKGKI